MHQKKDKIMKAAVFTEYGHAEVLKIKEHAKPAIKSNEILIRIHATAVNSGDWRIRRADPWAVRLFFGLVKPKYNVLGSVYAGEIEQIGSNVKSYKLGDAVFGHTDMKFGAYAEYLNVPESSTISLKPKNLNFEESACIPFGGLTALHFIKLANIQVNQKIIIIGASGAVGSAALQMAKAKGAEVTAVCSGDNIELVKSLGADYAIDYTKVDFTQVDKKYDVVFDSVNSVSVKNCKNVLNKNSVLVLSAAGMTEMFSGMFLGMFNKIKVIMGVVKHSQEDLLYLKNLIETGQYRAVLDRTYKLEDIAKAHEYVEKGHKKGNVAITI